MTELWWGVLLVLSLVLLYIVWSNGQESQENIKNSPSGTYEIKLYEGYRVSDVSKSFTGSVNKPGFHRIIFPFNLKSYSINIPALGDGRTMHVKLMSIYDGGNTASTIATGVGSNTYAEPEYTRTASPSKYKVVDEFTVFAGQSVDRAVDITYPVKRLMVTIIVN
jgi:hypothetical protein